ncbi:MAG: class I SAM-dependent methyltransferase [Anaerolineae bacterium]
MRVLPDPPFDHFSLVAPLYERFIRPPDVRWLRTLCAFAPHQWLLDVGGGTGRVSQYFRGDVAHVCILDLSVKMLREALTKGGLCAGLGAAERLPFRDGAFERIIAVDSFHHFRDHRRAAQELLRVLAPGGRLVIEEPDVRRFSVKLVALGETLTLMRSRFYPPHALMRFFAAPGVHLTLHESSPNFWLVVDKSAGAFQFRGKSQINA